jgi:tetratricopeptide (TPR) repeat protein
MDEAKEAFSTLIQQMPENPEPHFALGLVAMQGNDLNAAEASFKRALELRYEDEGTLNFLLGQVSEAQGAADIAIARYKTVTGRQQLDAGLRAAMLMGKAGRLPEARAWLAEMAALQSANADDRIARIAQTESQLLRDAKRYAEAFDVLDKALLRVPDGIELLYDRAMAAEKLNRLDVLERDLRRMIELKPDYAHAYNALGYTLADRTNRLSEAVTLLEKALSLAPEDPFILDSMGWALYKTKRYSEAISFLRRAYQARPDPDIAAHLGEVLWVKGERDEARKIWQNGLKLHPDNETLREVQSRLAP